MKEKDKLNGIIRFCILIAVIIPLTQAQSPNQNVAEIISPTHDSHYNRNGGIEIKWDSIQYEFDQDTLEESEITIADEAGNEVSSDIIGRGSGEEENVSNGDIVSESYTFSETDLDSLNNSVWEITVSDQWKQASQESATISIEAGAFGSFETFINENSLEENVDLSNGVSIEWESINDYSIEQTLQETEFTFTDNSGNTETITRDITDTVNSGSSIVNTESFNEEDFTNLKSGEWSLNVVDVWEENISNGDEVQFNVASGSVSVSIGSPSSGVSHDPSEDLLVDWSSVNDYDDDQMLQSSEVVIEDEDGNTVSQPITVEESVSQGATYDSSRTIVSSQLDGLNEGDWTVTVTDEWDYSQASESVTITGQSVEGTVSTSISDPSSTTTYNVSEDLSVEWSSTNNYNEGQELVESEVRVEGDSGIPYTETVSVGETVSSGSTFNHDALNLSSEDLSELNPGDWDVTVTDTWELDESSSTVTFTAEDQSQSNDEETESSANYSISISSPSSGSSFDYDSGEVGVEWTSSNDGDSSRELIESSVIFEGGAGLTEIDSIDRGEFVSSADSVSNSVIYDSSTWENLEPGSFTLTVRDSWEGGETVEESVDVTIDSEDSSQDSGDSDGSTGDSGSTDDSGDSDGSTGDSGSTDDSGDSDGSTGDSGSTDDSGDSDGSTGDSGDGSQDSSDGQDTDSSGSNDGMDDSDGSTGQQDSEDSSDNGDGSETSLLQQEVAVGISIQTVLIGVFALLVIGVLFKRSSYKLSF